MGCISSIEHGRFKGYRRKVPTRDISAIEGQSVAKLGEILVFIKIHLGFLESIQEFNISANNWANEPELLRSADGTSGCTKYLSTSGTGDVCVLLRQDGQRKWQIVPV